VGLISPPQCLTHPLKLAGMGIASDLARQPRCKPRIALAQRQTRFLRKRHQTLPRLLVKPCICGMSNCLFHHRGVHDHRLNAPFRDYPGLAPRYYRLGQKPSTPHLPFNGLSFLEKKWLATASSPIFACSSFICYSSISGAFLPPRSNTPEAPSSKAFVHMWIIVG